MDMFDFLTWEGCHGVNKFVACVADLGDVKSLTAIDNTGYKLETDIGLFEVDIRAYEPPFDPFGFVGVKLPKLVNGHNSALYFDPRIAAALHCSWSYGCKRFRCGEELDLMDEELAWKALKRLPYDEWAAERICNAITWVDEYGKPLANICDGVGELELRLWKLIQSPFPNDTELSLPHMEYVEKRNELFLLSRFEHYSAERKRLTPVG